jgi:phosphopantothenoylcysteine decarboxylase/phosphopantothenate--cysteine ligase
MHCIITAGPTFEPMDNVRRLTNFSTGRLGTELANHLAERGHEVTLLLGEQATYAGQRRAQRVVPFSTTADLLAQFTALARQSVDAVFHAAAVSDFAFGKIWHRSPDGELAPQSAGKISTRAGTLLAELVPTPKVIAELRRLFPHAKLVGWKFEVDGDRGTVLAAAVHQLRECRTDACVANGPAYGPGFGLVTSDGENLHQQGPAELFAALTAMIERPGGAV